LILFLEDIHWADSASLGLLHYIAKVIRSERILILATFRSEELNVDEEGHPHPLVEALQLMRRENLFEEVRLQGLDNQNIGKVAESMVNGSIDPQLAKKLAEESQGNPLFVVESLRMLHERKSLFQDNNQWRLAVDELGIPSKIKEIILRRLGTLKLSQRRVLDAASVIGDKFNIELLGAVLKQDSLEVLETLNFVAQSTSLVCCEKDYFRFDHAKSRETLYEEIPLPLQKGYHSRIAEKLEASAKGEDLPLSEMAYHYAKAGNQEKALKFSMAAGKEALSRFSNNEAIAHFKYVLDTIGEAPEHSNERLLALEGLGDAYQANSLFKEAAKIFELLASLATGITKLRAFNKAMGATFVVGDYNHTNELLK
jgi:predicted ATPase